MKKNQLLIDIMIILGISTILAFWFNGLSNPNAISLIREKQALEIANDDEFEQINTNSAISSDTLPIKDLPKDTLPIKKDSVKPIPSTQQVASANDGIDYVREVCKGGTRNGLQTVSKDIRASNCNLRRTRQAHC